MKVFLDIDGVLLGVDRERPSRTALADHALAFLEFVVGNFEVYWLAPQCRGNAPAATEHLVRHAKMSDRERLMSVCAKVRATDYVHLRTEALPTNGEEFVWIDDGPDEGEMASLREDGLLDRWLWIDTRDEPEDLLRAKQQLEKLRVSG